MQITQGEYQNVEKIFVQNEMDAEVGSVISSTEKASQDVDETTQTKQMQSKQSDKENLHNPMQDIARESQNAALDSTTDKTSNDETQCDERERTAFANVENGDEKAQTKNAEGGEKPDTYNEKSNCEQDEQSNRQPIYERQEWKDRTDNFFESYPLARSFAVEIGKEIAGDDQLARNESCLEIALAKVLSKAYISPQEMILNKDFVDRYVLTNEQIKSTIIDGYIQSLEQNSPPKSMMGRGQIILSPPNKPKSIEEAGEIIKKMLINRRI